MSGTATTEELLLAENWRQLFDCEKWRIEYLIHLAESDEINCRDRARLLLSGLRKRECRDELCRLALESERQWLNELLAATDFLPADQKELSLFLLATKQWDRYLREFSNHAPTILRLAEPTPLSQRIIQQFSELRDLAAVKVLIAFFLESTVGSGAVSSAVKIALASLPADSDGLRLLCKSWFETRDHRLFALVSKIDSLPQGDDALLIALALKMKKPFPMNLEIRHVRLLCAFLSDPDLEIVREAEKCLKSQDSVDVQNFLFAEYFCGANPALNDIAAGFSFVPQAANDRVLFYLLIQNWDELVKIDPLGKAVESLYRSANESLKERISNALRASAHAEWIVNATGASDKLRLSTMTDLDWQLLQNSLSASSSWPEIWKLIPLMPAHSARRFLRRLAQVAWRPALDEDAQRFDRLLTLAKRLTTEQVSIWSDIEYFNSIDLGAGLITNVSEGGVAALESRFGFNHNGTAFYYLDRSGALHFWNLPSLLAGRLSSSELPALSCFALSPVAPIMAFAEANGSSSASKNVHLFDLLERRVFASTRGYDAPFDYNISNLEFSAAGKYLTACQRKKERNTLGNGILWRSHLWETTGSPFPAKAVFSADDSSMLYRKYGAVSLSNVEGRRNELELSNPLFRIRQMGFVPDKSSVYFSERNRFNFHDASNLARRSSVICDNEGVVQISNLSSNRLLSFDANYSWSLIDTARFELVEQSASFRSDLLDRGLRLGAVTDLHGSASTHTVLQVMKDPQSQMLALLHAAGQVTFWQPSLAKYARKSAALLDENDMANLRAYLLSAKLGESEMNWLRFILELAGSMDHYAIELADASTISLAGYDIEIA